jgi:hypothetical protein
MLSNTINNRLLESYGYKLQTISWEDTARTKNSCWGPNISDMTLKLKSGERMPMIRKPNFVDVTYDVDISKFKLPLHNIGVKNIVSLKEYLKDINKYVDNPNVSSMLLDRDEKILTQVQTCVLQHKPEEKQVEFTVNIYNYQTKKENPKVLVILVSKNGTSTQVLTDERDLYFNDNSKAHYFKAERLGDVRLKQGKSGETVSNYKDMTDEEKLDNCLMVIQVPLKDNPDKPKRPLAKFCSFGYDEEGDEEESDKFNMFGGSVSKKESRSPRSIQPRSRGMDMGVLSKGTERGKYVGTGTTKLMRDERYPIRCTYQYYRLTDEENLSEELVKNIVEQLDNINNIATSSGSLVMSNTDRITEPRLESKLEPSLEVEKNVNWNNQTMLAM